MENMKKMWAEPSLEMLEVGSTFEGKGTKAIDFISPSDMDVYDPAPIS